MSQTKTSLKAAIHRAHVRFQHAQGASDIVTPYKAPTFYEPTSITWILQHRAWKPRGYYRLHCCHDRVMWEKCGTCGRTHAQAQENFLKLLQGKPLS